MPIQLTMDAIRIAGAEVPLALPIRARPGDRVEISGWTIDPVDQASAAKLVLHVHDTRFTPSEIPAGATRTFDVRAGIARPDLAPVIGRAAADAGFVVAIETNHLPPSLHRIVFIATSSDGGEWSSAEIPLQIGGTGSAAERHPQIVIAAAMKSAGRHVQQQLLAYYGIHNPAWGPGTDGEHLLTDEFIKPALAHPFVMHAHLLGRGVNIVALAANQLRAVLTWRNLGDVVVSLDDHVRTAPEVVWRNTYVFLAERESYAALPDQQRFRFQIRNAIPWYLDFYVSWRAARVPLMLRYEWMVHDEYAYLRYLIEQIDGRVDEAWLRDVVATGPTDASGFNVGLVGRSATALSEESQEMLEASIREHPHDLGELLFELPWYDAKYGAPVLVTTGSNEVYLIAEGVKRRAGAHWLHTNGYRYGTPASVSPGDIASLRNGADLY